LKGSRLFIYKLVLRQQKRDIIITPLPKKGFCFFLFCSLWSFSLAFRAWVVGVLLATKATACCLFFLMVWAIDFHGIVVLYVVRIFLVQSVHRNNMVNFCQNS